MLHERWRINLEETIEGTIYETMKSDLIASPILIQQLGPSHFGVANLGDPLFTSLLCHRYEGKMTSAHFGPHRLHETFHEKVPVFPMKHLNAVRQEVIDSLVHWEQERGVKDNPQEKYFHKGLVDGTRFVEGHVITAEGSFPAVYVDPATL